MEIREYQRNDLADVIQLWQECGLVVPQNDPKKDISRKIENSGELFLVAVEEERVVGSIMGGYEGHRGWINYLAVKPEYRGRGFGKKLMKEIEKRLLAMNVPKINLQVRSTNQAILKFYEKVGYRVDDVICMGKRLIKD